MRSIVCAAAIIREGDRILVAQRKEDSSLEPLKWEFPGGKIEFAEDPRACLAREIREEMGIDIAVDEIFEVASHNYVKDGAIRHVLLLCYLCTYRGGEPRTLDCHDVRWVGAGQIGELDFAAADVPVVEKVRARLWGG